MSTITSADLILPGQLHRSHLRAVVVIAVLNGLDILTTVLCLRAGGVEGNPLAQVMLDYNLLWPSKVALPLLAVVLVVAHDQIEAWGRAHRPRWLPRTNLPDLSRFAVHNLAWFVAGIYALVVVLNTLTYLTPPR
jgi:hypothetical protein